MATVILRRSERQFWKMTPKKLNALVNIYVMVNGGEDDGAKASTQKQGFIDQVM